MCHGNFSEKRAAISVPALLRNQCYQIPDDSSKKEEQEQSGYNVDVLGEPLEISDDVLADIVGKRFDDSEDVDIVEADAFASTGSLSTWFDCIKDDFGVVDTTDVIEKTVAADEPVEEKKSVCKSRKARKSAVKESVSHAQHDSEMDDGTPVLIDDKRKRRMSSNRASAQRSRQRKQERLDELEILTAQLRLENATLSRRSKIAEQLAKRFEAEKNELAKKVADLSKELEAARHLHSDSGDESNTSDNMVGGETPEKESVKHSISSSDLFQEMVDAIDSDQFDVCLGGEEISNLLPEDWFGSFTECLNAA